ncbi:MAG: saccharopine dehydrogenase NADP-binding domain-containing protein [Alphaproteobacteria bacterium]|nr:saccharopine dehydrogenase NADP-binding domain-containing protein [Alphaproteobacteria bacterium]
MPDRDHDLVLLGATGFTGALVADWLVRHRPDGLRLALAGRNRDKLAAVRAQLAVSAPAAADLPLLVVDSHDDGDMARLAASTKAVCTTVGPYLAHGLPLVVACAAAGTHVCDLTGEVPFIRRSIDACHDAARSSGARIVHCCGYDSIPSDLGTYMVQAAMTAAGAPATRVTTVVGPQRGGVSGGTTASLLGVLELAQDPSARRAIADTYALDPAGTPRGPRVRDQAAPRWRDDVGQWTAPFVMAAINTRVVRRSHALRGLPWGPDFVYEETMATGGGVRGRARALGITAGLGALLAVGSSATGRRLLERTVLPAPGDGPDEATREGGFFRHLVLAEGPDHRLVGRVVGTKDPGYGETAKMLGETAIALAADADRLPDVAGVLTPSVALGDVLLDRLRAAGMTWAVEPWPEGTTPRP